MSIYRHHLNASTNTFLPRRLLLHQVGQLGSGKSGTMKLLKNRKTGELVAAKYVERVAGAGLSKNTEREIVNHRRLLHHNIIRFYEVHLQHSSCHNLHHTSQRVFINSPWL